VTEGTVTHTTDFGAFVDIGSGVEGLAHVSEIPNGEQSLAALKSNTPVKVKILHIDTHQRRVSLRIESDDPVAEDVEPDSSPDEPETLE
jgi:small subunit ribosomal protein S1